MTRTFKWQWTSIGEASTRVMQRCGPSSFLCLEYIHERFDTAGITLRHGTWTGFAAPTGTGNSFWPSPIPTTSSPTLHHWQFCYHIGWGRVTRGTGLLGWWRD